MRDTRWGWVGLLRWAVVALALAVAYIRRGAEPRTSPTSSRSRAPGWFSIERPTRSTRPSPSGTRRTRRCSRRSPSSSAASRARSRSSNKAGLTADRKPYVSPMAAGSLLQSGGAITVVLKYANPQRVTFTSTLQILRTVEVPPDAPTLIGVIATGGTNAFLVGRVDGAVNQPIGLQASSATTCVAGVLANGGARREPGSDDDGRFGLLRRHRLRRQSWRFRHDPSDVAGERSVVVVPGELPRQRFLAEGVPARVGTSASARDYIDSPGKARWYKFAVTPGSAHRGRADGPAG